MARKVKSKHAVSVESEEQPIWQRPVIWIALAGGIVLALILIFVAGSQGDAPAVTTTSFWNDIPTDGRTAGPDDAPVTLVEYSDYACPHCMTFHEDTLIPVAEEYIATGEVQLQVQPVAYLGEDSQRAAEAALCAEDQGAFWPYHDRLFQAQAQFGRSAFTNARLKEYAGDVGLNQNTFNTCLDSGQHRGDVLDIVREAQSRGVTGTPTTFVNGTLVNGAVPYEQFVSQHVEPYVN